MSHHCRALVLHCIDFRLGKSIKNFLQEQELLGDADLVSLAGAAKNFVDPLAEPLVMRQIEISKKLHGIREVYLINHTDCGAYGGRDKFASTTAEHNVLAGDLRTAAEMITAKFSDLSVKCWIAHIEGGGHVRYEQVSE
ncbi:hypothetical protein EPN90_00265 [Patescibacteria group bacterium]|nr:MAG: hypothetical protein EPN90_00265 [Patescibacteria group bacterium]